MATKTLITPMDGTPVQIVLRDPTDFSPTAANDLRNASGTSLIDMNLEGVLDTEARESDKFDLGAHWAEKYFVRGCFEFASAPNAGDLIELYFGWSQSATAATANPAGLTGTDADYAGYSSNLGDSVKQLDGPLLGICTAQTTQILHFGIIYPPHQYGICVCKNESNANFFGTDAAELHIVIDPVVPEFQDA